MNEAINDGRGKGSVIVQGFAPVAECAIGGNDHGAAFIAIGDDLKEQFGALLIHGQIAELINDEQLGMSKTFQGTKERVVGQRGGQVIDKVHGGGEVSFYALLTGVIAQSEGDMGFTGAGRSHEDGIVFLFDKGEIKEA